MRRLPRWLTASSASKMVGSSSDKGCTAMNVSNHSCIRRLSIRALMANRTRNLVAVLTIALTALLFTSLFTIALSINEGV